MFQKNLVVWKLNLYGIEIFACLMFQKNLVVWKHDGIWFCNTTLLISFQKNLVVWKQKSRLRDWSFKDIVSEELSSVETTLYG